MLWFVLLFWDKDSSNISLIGSMNSFCRTTNYCLNVAAEQEKTITERWLPELSNAIQNAHKCLEDCKYVRGLVRAF